MLGRHLWHSSIVIAAVLAACGDNLEPSTGTDNLPPTLAAFTLTTAEDTPITQAIPATDPDGNALTFAFGPAMHGTVTASGTNVTYTPAANYTGTDWFTVTASDGFATVTATATVMITSMNDGPLAGDDLLATPEDTALTLTPAQLLSNDVDADGDTLTLTGVADATNGTVSMTGSNVVFTPTANFVGSATFSYTVSDGTLTDIAAVTVTVGGENDVPVAIDDDATTNEDTALVLTAATLLADDTDPDGQTVTLTAVGNPTNGTVALAGTDITFTPAANFFGTATFEYTVSDGALPDTGLVTITVTAVNDAPVAMNDTADTDEDVAVVIPAASLLANDTDVENTVLSVMSVATATNGSVSMNGTDITFTPAAGFSGDATFEYTVTDGDLPDTATVTIAVGPVNDAPIAGNDDVTTPEDTTLVIPMAELLADDSDSDGPQPIAVLGVQNAANGSVFMGGSNITFIPAPNFAGTATFEYEITDGDLEATATVTVIVTPVNDAPVANNDSASTNEDVALVLAASTLLDNDTDLDLDTLAITGVSNAVNGSVSQNGSTITFTPTPDFFGTASFDYTIFDGALPSTATVTITVASVNDAPVAVGDNVAAVSGRANTYGAASLLTNDTDIDGPVALAITGVSNANNGSVSLASGVITFTPSILSGTASFQYTISDSLAPSTATVTVSVTNPCGNGVLDAGELCDDHDLDNGDGCSSTCVIEPGFSCAGVPSTCTAICSDSIVAGSEGCDDGFLNNGDGCSSTCQIEPGYICAGSPSTCVTDCGDRVVTFDEECDDGNNIETDGCTSNCTTVEICDATTHPGGARFATDPVTGNCYVSYETSAQTYDAAQAACVTDGGYLVTITSAAEQSIVFGLKSSSQVPWLGGTDEVTEGTFAWVTGEAFAYTNYVPGQPDALDPAEDCLYMSAQGTWADAICLFSSPGRICEYETDPCGDGVLHAGETCDDRNNVSGDGCSATCSIEAGATCNTTVSPTLCGKLVINEIDYDTLGTENSNADFEFVELYNAGTGPVDLTNIALVLVNGGTATPSEYFFDGTSSLANVTKRIQLSTATSQLPAGTFIVLAPDTRIASLPASAYTISIVAPSGGWLQNGGPDAVGLFDVVAGTMIDSVSYEGSTDAAALHLVTGNVAVTEGTGAAADDGLTLSQSLRRVPNGRDTQDNSSDVAVGASTPGASNL